MDKFIQKNILTIKRKINGESYGLIFNSNYLVK